MIITLIFMKVWVLLMRDNESIINQASYSKDDNSTTFSLLFISGNSFYNYSFSFILISTFHTGLHHSRKRVSEKRKGYTQIFNFEVPLITVILLYLLLLCITSEITVNPSTASLHKNWSYSVFFF